MLNDKYSFLLGIVCGLLFGAQGHATAPKPITGKWPQGITLYGTYADGCLLEEKPVDPKDYPSFKAAFESPNRFAHPSLISVLKNLEAAYRRQSQDSLKKPIQIGEISRKGGGVTLPHFSHQLGLDVDFYFFSLKADAKWPFDYVDTGVGVTDEFDLEKNWWLAGYLALLPQVDRIFVAPEVKVVFCRQQDKLKHWPGKKPLVLSKLRAWFGHRDHFHLRLKCPAGEAYCFNRGSSLGQDSGCDRAQKWIQKAGHQRVRPRLDYAKKGKFNRRCWPKEPNQIAYPGAKEFFSGKR